MQSWRILSHLSRKPIILVLIVFLSALFTGCGKKAALNKGVPPTLQTGASYEMAKMSDLNAAPRQLRATEGQPAPDFNTEEYDIIRENTFKTAMENPLSTFSIDVDTAAYSNLRRFITANRLPPADAVRIEEMINYFDYDYPQPEGEHPFAVVTEIGPCPWKADHLLAHIGIQGKNLDYENLSSTNLVFLIDSSGSMQAENKLPLLKRSLKLLLDELGERDRIAIVAYAGAAGLVLPPTPASEKKRIISALDSLRAGGSTAGGEGIRLAYATALESLIPEGNNRVILATDGDFNIGVSSTAELVRLIEEKRQSGIYLTILGFGMGNYKDGRMEQISNAGNGNYFYIDNIREAQKVFVREMRANLFTIAGDVKIQVEFNPANVAAWRLIGYENRLLAREDFDDDTKDAGELGAGHTVTALYEIVPAGAETDLAESAPLKYQETRIKADATGSDELMSVRLRYKPIGQASSRLIETIIADKAGSLDATSDDFRFSAAVAGFGMLLRDSDFKGNLTWNEVLSLAKGAKGVDENGDREEMIRMVETCELLAR